MAYIRPFKGVIYNTSRIGNLPQVICPPYDIITPQLQEELYHRDEHNFVRIEFNLETSKDSNSDNRYTRAAAFMQGWLEQGILQFETLPAIYYHQHYFTFQGKSCTRNNLVAAVKLEEWSSRIVRPHENIIPRAKSDRLQMLEACHANTSPVLAMYKDRGHSINSVMSRVAEGRAKIDVIDPWGERHRVWSIVEPGLVSVIQDVVAGQPLYIADGHHRYDSALTYRNRVAAESGSNSEDAGYNFVMTSLIDFADPGLIISPSHRLVKGLAREKLDALTSKLEHFFSIEEISLGAPELDRILDSNLSGISPDSSIIKLAVCGLQPGKMQILTLHDFSLVAAFMPEARSEIYGKLDVSLVDHVILEGLLGVSQDSQEGMLAYYHDRLAALDSIKTGDYQLAFILNPVKPEIIRAIADAGDRMPRKSTYFFPKAPAGLVFYKW